MGTILRGVIYRSLFLGILFGPWLACRAYDLPNFNAKLAELAAGQTTRANVVVIGDSISLDLVYPTFAKFNNMYGYAGTVGGPGQIAINTLYFGGAAQNVVNYDSNGDFSQWMTGMWVNVPQGGSVIWQRGDQLPSTQSPTPDVSEEKLYYMMGPDGGTFKVESMTYAQYPNGVNYQTGSWTDVPGFTNISTYSPTPEIGVLTVPLHGNVGAMIVGTSGTVRALPSGWQGDSGISWNFQLSVGGSQLKQYASAPASVWNAWLDEVKPDLVIIMAKDTAEPELTDALKTIQGYINSDAPNADTLYVGAYSQQSGPSTDMNDIFQAEANDTSDGASKVYWNADPVIGDWTDASAKGWFADSTHLSGAGREILGQAWANDFGYFQSVPEPPAATIVIMGFGLAYGFRCFLGARKTAKIFS